MHCGTVDFKKFWKEYILYMVFFVMTSILHLLFIALERLLVVLRPIKYKIFFTRKKACISSAMLWILEIMVSAMVKIIHEFTDISSEGNKIEETQNQNLYAMQLANLSINVSSIAKKSPVRLPSFITDAQLTL